MQRKLRTIRSQAIVESIFILSVLAVFLIGTYIVGKIIFLKTNQTTINRSNAFYGTYRKIKQPSDTFTTKENKEINASYRWNENRANSDKDYGSFGFFKEIFNLMHNTQKYETKADTDIENELSDFLEYGKYRAQNSEKIYMDKGTFYKNKKLRAALYGIAFAKSFISRDTKIESLGSDLLNESSEFCDKEDIFMK